MSPRLVDLCGGWAPVSVAEPLGGVCVLEVVSEATEVVLEDEGNI